MFYHIRQIVIFALLCSRAVAGPLVERQASTRWNDRYIKEPRNFKVTKINKCSYQLTFERDYVDSRYRLSFAAVYANGISARVSPIEGGLPISRTEPIFSNQSPTDRYSIGEQRVLSVHEIHGACSNGAAPTAFRFLANLDCPECYTYKNNYTTAPIAITAGPIPGVPQNVKVQRSANGYTVTWDGVAGATGYFALGAGTVPNSEVGEVNDIDTIVTDSNGRSAKFGNRTTSVAVVARGSAGVVSRTGRVPEVEV